MKTTFPYGQIKYVQFLINCKSFSGSPSHIRKKSDSANKGRKQQLRGIFAKALNTLQKLTSACSTRRSASAKLVTDFQSCDGDSHNFSVVDTALAQGGREILFCPVRSEWTPIHAAYFLWGWCSRHEAIQMRERTSLDRWSSCSCSSVQKRIQDSLYKRQRQQEMACSLEGDVYSG